MLTIDTLPARRQNAVMGHWPEAERERQRQRAASAPVNAAADLPQTDDIAELCRAATPAAIRRLVEIALTTDSEAVAVAAIKEINDRGWGKAAQAIKGDYQFTLIVNTGVNAPAMLPAIEGAVLPAVAAQIASDVASGSE